MDVLDYDYICKGASHNGRVNIRATQIVATSIQQERSETEQYWNDGCLISAGVPYGGIDGGSFRNMLSDVSLSKCAVKVVLFPFDAYGDDGNN